MVAVRERGPDPLEQAWHPGALVVVARLPRARADAAADDQHVHALTWASAPPLSSTIAGLQRATSADWEAEILPPRPLADAGCGVHTFGSPVGFLMQTETLADRRGICSVVAPDRM